MKATNFVALTGHLNDYPLADLISILRRQRKTGRLLIEYSLSPCSFFFVDGDLVDAQLNTIGGLQAVFIALSQPNAAFNFNPLIQPSRRSINESSQKVILELLGCWDEKTIDTEAARVNGGSRSSIPPPEILMEDAPEPEALPRAKEVLALPPSSLEQLNRRRNRRVLIASAIISLLVSLVTVVALARWWIRKDVAAAIAETSAKSGAVAQQMSTSAQTVKVTVRVENGRVREAFVEGHQAGMESYEGLALRIARGRRYSPTASGEETIEVKINAPE